MGYSWAPYPPSLLKSRETSGMSNISKLLLFVGAVAAIVFTVGAIIDSGEMMTEEMRAERCAVIQGPLPAVGGIFYRRLDGLKVQVLDTRFVYGPSERNARNNIENFCAYVIDVRLEGHAEESYMKLFEFAPPPVFIEEGGLTLYWN